VAARRGREVAPARAQAGDVDLLPRRAPVPVVEHGLGGAQPILPRLEAGGEHARVEVGEVLGVAVDLQRPPCSIDVGLRAAARSRRRLRRRAPRASPPSTSQKTGSTSSSSSASSAPADAVHSPPEWKRRQR
jgi:hypothetical protein